MPDQKLRSQIVSHRVLNYLNAAYQGRFAFYNILSQLKHPRFSLDEIKGTKASIGRINAWLDTLWEGGLLFDEAKITRQTPDALAALETLEGLLPELSDLAHEIKRIFGQESFAENVEDVAFIVAAYGRNAYARDNYVRGFLEFGRIFNDPDLVSSWKQQLDFVTAEVKQANEFMLMLKENRVESPRIYEHLKFLARTLPGIFRAHTHDIRQLLCTYRWDFNFDKAAIEKHEARLWERAEIGAVEAGYWRAHGFNPDETAEWKKYEIIDPLVASEWLTTGFTPPLAEKWIRQQFSPLLALQWQLEDYHPEQAAELVRKGYLTPLDVPSAEQPPAEERRPAGDEEGYAAAAEEDEEPAEERDLEDEDNGAG